MKRYLWIISALLFGIIIYNLNGYYFELDHLKSSVLSIMCTAIFLWVSEVLPLYITSMFASFLLIVISDFSTKEVFHPYFDPVIMLFLGGFLLARALNKYRIDHFGAQLLLSRVGTKPSTFLLALMFFTAFLSRNHSKNQTQVLLPDTRNKVDCSLNCDTIPMLIFGIDLSSFI